MEGGLGRGAQVVAEEQGGLFRPGAVPAHVDVGSRLARTFAEVPFTKVAIIRAPAVADLFQGGANGAERLKVGYRDLDVDNGLGRQAGNGGGADVVDAQRRLTQRPAQPGRERLEAARPRLVVGNNQDWFRGGRFPVYHGTKRLYSRRIPSISS